MMSLVLAPIGVLLGLIVLALAGGRTRRPAAQEAARLKRDTHTAPEALECGACHFQNECTARRTNQRQEQGKEA